MPNFMKIHQVGGEFVPCGIDRQSNITRPIVAFRSSAKAPRKRIS